MQQSDVFFSRVKERDGLTIGVRHTSPSPVIHSTISKTLTRGPVGVREVRKILARSQRTDHSTFRPRPKKRGRRTGQLSLHGGDAKPN